MSSVDVGMFRHNIIQHMVALESTELASRRVLIAVIRTKTAEHSYNDKNINLFLVLANDEQVVSTAKLTNY